MTADALAQAVRHQLRPGRLLPLGDPGDGAWLAERAAAGVLRAAAAREVPGLRLGAVRLSRTGSDSAAPSQVPAPPTALVHGPLRLDADIAVTPELPLRTAADKLRDVLLTAADRQLGLRVTTADLRITQLLTESGDGEEDGEGERGEGNAAEPYPDEPPPPAPADCPRSTATAEAVIAVQGVARLAPLLGPPRGSTAGAGTDAVTVMDTEGGGRHLRIQLAVSGDSRTLNVVRAVRKAAAKAAAWDAEELTGPVTVAVLVTAVDPVAAE